MRRPGAPLPFALLAALAGCLSATDPGLAPAADGLLLDVESFALPFLEQDHDHGREHTAHAGTLGVDVLATVAARSGSYPDGETYFEVAVKGGHAFLTFGPKSGYLAPGVEAGFLVYDLSDPASPREVGRWLGQPLGDIEASDDGRWVFASTQRNGYPYPYTVNAGALPAGEFPRGTYILDAADPAHPTFVSFNPLPPNGPHTITYYRMPDGRELLLQSTYDIAFTQYPDNLGQLTATQKVVLSEIVAAGSEGGARVLRPLSVFQIPSPDPPGGAQYLPHDATVHVDPATQRVVMDVAYWDHGLVLVDITDPAQPKELARFADTGPSRYTNTHLARVFPGTIGGRVVAVLEPEIPSGTDAGQYTFVDVTDPAAPKRLGYWALPGDHAVDKPFIFSPHNFDLACGGNGQATGRPIDYGAPCQDPRVVLSHFHGGLWVLDASDPAAPRAVAFHFPLVARGNVGEGFPFTGFATAFAVDGHVFAPEAWTGLNVLRLTPAPDAGVRRA